MSMTPKTIQIYLPGGDPRGIRVAELTTRIVQLIEVPRSLLQDFIKMPESNQVALYFLFGGAEDGLEPKVYIGQTGDLRARLVKHNKEKDFWQRALVLISRTNSLTQTHALFLEWHSLQAAAKAARYSNDNGNSGSKPHTPAPLEADCLEIFETGQVLLATLGYPVFDAVRTPVPSSDPEEILYCKASGADGRGLYTPEGFVVLTGSIGRKANVPSIVGTSDERFRNKLLESGVMYADGEKVVFPKDHLFGSPSMAAIALTGRNANGWLEWRSKDGTTLDELKRQPPGESS
jgi:predicted GIY-YIG superfamily endonuclease